MAKTYYHVFACNRRPSHDGSWFHEASRDTRFDANDDRDGLKRDGYKVRIIRSSDDPLRLLAELNAEVVSDGQVLAAHEAGMTAHDDGASIHDNPYVHRSLREAFAEGWYHANRSGSR